MKILAQKREEGFSIIEMVVSAAIFGIVIVIASGSLVRIIDANKKVRAAKVVMNNLSFAAESITRRIRVGANYHCGADANITAAKDCSSPASALAFVEDPTASPKNYIEYALSGSSIVMAKNPSNPSNTDPASNPEFIAVTPPEIRINQFDVYVLGAENCGAAQPRVHLIISGAAGADAKSMTSFTIQTMISERFLNTGI